VTAGRNDDDLDRELIELLNELRVALPGWYALPLWRRVERG
jgi:hypothetical protein